MEDPYNSIVPDSVDEYEPNPKKSKFSADEKMKRVADASSSSQRLLGEEDEILVLQGLTEFYEKNGNNSTISEFCNVMASSLGENVSQKQLNHIVCCMKRKFEDKEMKICDDDESPAFASLHDQKVYELSKMIWGNRITTTTTTTTTTDVAAAAADSDANNEDRLGMLFYDYYSRHGLNLDLFEESKGIYLAKRWVKFKVSECKYLIQRSKFEAKMQNVKLQAYKKESVGP
ncbi:hypothetical protein PanWU01x14_351750 [Parasponia andersonii]|uniref:Glabrous enhancer-binding protein-like DBD domain-containing protein n=1 Tax=Parasponia andersonii TaxID=3476 RepID=A0A2P5AAJ9_PARAD|nr:hypothetical protein PanWU01x14_351750 [Parasponia andersonii]